MTRRFTEAEVLERIALLTHPRLSAWIEARIVQPVQSESGPLFREVDLARLQTLCDLAFDLGAEDDHLAVMMDLIDRLHALTAEMDTLMAALATQPEEVRARIRALIAAR